MKSSEISVSTVRDYTHAYEIDDAIIDIILKSVISYVINYTGLLSDDIDLPMKRIDKYEEISLAILVICSEMYENRLMSVKEESANRVIESILGMHAVNLL